MSKKKKKLNGFQTKMRNKQIELNNEKKLIIEFRNDMERIIQRKDLNFSNPQFQASQISINSVNDLPRKISKKVKSLNNKNNFKVNRCWYVSHFITHKIDGVKSIHGWIGEHLTSHWEGFEQSLLKMGKDINNCNLSQMTIDVYVNTNRSKIIRKEGDLVMMKDTSSNGSHIIWIDTKNDLLYIRHAWNEYDGMYFDVSKEGDETYTFDELVNADYRMNGITERNQIETLNDIYGNNFFNDYIQFRVQNTFKRERLHNSRLVFN